MKNKVIDIKNHGFADRSELVNESAYHSAVTETNKNKNIHKVGEFFHQGYIGKKKVGRRMGAGETVKGLSHVVGAISKSSCVGYFVEISHPDCFCLEVVES
jgi:hypothetical protein